MKKTLVALAVTAFAASATASNIFDKDGTTVDFDGQIRLLLQNHSEAVKERDQAAKKADGHTNLINNGSRFGFTIKHQTESGVYGLGRYETRLGAGSKNTAAWGGVTTENAYVGLGGFGHQVTFGKQAVIGDEVGQAGFDKVYNVGSENIKGGFDILTASSDSAVYYSYTGIDGLKLGANYNFANERYGEPTTNQQRVDAKEFEVIAGNEKSGFGLGAIYTAKLAEDQKLTVSTGYTHDDYATGKYVDDNGAEHTVKEKNKDGVYFGLKYQAGQVTVGLDGGRGVVKHDKDKTTLKFVRTGARYDIQPDVVGVYGSYSYGVVKAVTTSTTKNKAHQFMLGADYKVHKNVLTFVEGRVIKGTEKAGTTSQVKTTDRVIGVGLRVLW